jgi:hypothetical protein
MGDGPFWVEEQHGLVGYQELLLVSLGWNVGPSRIQHPLGHRYELVSIGHNCDTKLVRNLILSSNLKRH